MRVPFLILALIPLRMLSQSLDWSHTFVAELGMNQSRTARDHKGNTWCMMVAMDGINFPELDTRFPRTYHGGHAIVRINQKGKMDEAIHVETLPSWRGIGAMACGANNDLYLLIPYQDTAVVRTTSDSITVVTSQPKSGLLLAAVNTRGRIRFAKNLDVKNYDNTLDIAIDAHDNVHILTQEQFDEYDPERAGIVHRHALLHHVLADRDGHIRQEDVLDMGRMSVGNVNGSHLHLSPAGDLYITTKYQRNILLNGAEIVPDMNTGPPETAAEDHGVLLHFDNQGRFTWYRSISGNGSQWIPQITSDSVNVYINACFHYEACVNQQNTIIHDYKTPITSGGMLRVCMDHGGRIKWTDQVATRRHYNASVSCWGLETDGKGTLVYFCNFSDSIVIRGKNQDYVLRTGPYKNPPSTFIMVCDTLGFVLDVTTHAVQKKGGIFILDSSIHDQHIAVTGYFNPGFKGIEWDDKDKAWTKWERPVDILIRVGDKQSEPFRQDRFGGLFFYSYYQPPVKDDPDDTTPLYIHQPDTLHPVVYESTIRNPVVPGPIQLPADTTATLTVVDSQPASPISLDIYPNPTRSHLIFAVEGLYETCDLMIHDMQGRLVFSKHFIVPESQLEMTYDVSEWAAGTYMLTVLTGRNGMVSKRWVKMG